MIIVYVNNILKNNLIKIIQIKKYKKQINIYNNIMKKLII